ncbi:hypothetical protein EV421DRAFT_2045202 [Armillaria borealis]|uniref:Uncharacterized protein n=1 Tax=Armillaria borealis TaxID=47425 RepID=A0AA39IDW4_9AGAR|nr:hypothetical protein EV421DRAFT_2045202 [Armillaria borealis]
MKTPSCIVPGNPDITGIGVRLALYIQSASIVGVSILFSKRKNIPSSLAAAWRVQIYYTIAIVIAALLQRFFNQISLFHEFASFNLAYISLMSGIAAMGTEMRVTREPGGGTLEPGSRAVHIASSRPISRPKEAFYIVTRFPSTAVTMWYGARILLYILFCLESISLAHGCQGNSDSSANNQVWWWFLGAHVNLAKMWYLPVCIFMASCILRVISPLHLISSCVFGKTWEELRFMSTAVEFVILVVGIEVSIHMNGLESAENALGFGQVQ